MVLLRSGSVTSSDISTMAEMTSDQFALMLVETWKLPDIQVLIKNIVTSDKELYIDLLSAEVHRQTKPLKAQLREDNEIEALKETIQMQQTKLDDLDQHGRRDSLWVAGIPENPDHDDTDAAVLEVCQLMKVDPPLEAKDIAVSHRVGKQRQGQHRQILVTFATRNVRERVFRAKSALKDVNSDANSGRKIYINEDLTQRRAALARDARSLKNNGAIADTWTIYGKVFVKDVHNHVSVIAQPRDLSKYRPLVNRTNEAPVSNQVTTEISWTNMTNNFFADFCDWLSPFFPSYTHLYLFKKDLYGCVYVCACLSYIYMY